MRHRRIRQRALADRKGLRNQLLGLGEPARGQRKQPPRGLELPELCGLSKIPGDIAQLLQLELGFADVPATMCAMNW